MRKINIFIIAVFLLSSILSYASVGEGNGSKNEKFSSSYFLKKIQSGTTVAKVFGVDKTVNIKFKNPQDATKTISTSAGTFKGEVDGISGSFYCVDLFHYVQWYTSTNPHTYTDNGTVAAQILYILNNYYPFKAYPYSGAASSVSYEAAAVQSALWHFSDGLDVSTIDVTNVKTRAEEIVNDAKANYQSFYPFETLLIVPASQSVVNGSAASFFVSAMDANGNPLSGVKVTLSTSSGSLSTNEVITGANGNSPIVTITNSANTNATITATANVLTSLGTRYVHSVEPDKWQKLVLATPSGIQKKTTATVEWYQKGACDTKGFVTFTQGGWGNKSGTPGKIRDAYFSSVFPNGLTLGIGKTLKLSTSEKVKNFLPQGGTAGVFTQNYVDVTSTSAGVLAGQLVALKLNVEFSAAGKLGTNSTKLGDLQISSGPFAGKTVNEFLQMAEIAIGGGSLNGFTFSQFNDAATAINENFDNGTVDKKFLTCKEINVKASIGDKVWNDINQNGIQENNESGVQNVTVKLYDCNNNLISTKTTDSNGKYLFDNLNPGDYYIKFELPTGFVFSKKDATDDDVDSDADISTGKTICTTLIAGENDLTWDAGIYQQTCKNKIGDYVWHDKNINGLQDAGEKGIEGVEIELLKNNSVIATTKTDANGKYEFLNLENGTYSVRVSNKNFVSGGVLFNTDKTKWYFTKKNQGTNDLIDSDGIKDELVSVTLNCNDNITVDFGFYKTCITVTKTANVQTAKVNDEITYTFVVENCGDVQHHGGIDLFDKMLNPVSPYKIKHIDLLDAGKSTSFTMKYKVKQSDCGDLINEVNAEGHPVDGSAYVKDKSIFTVKVNCQTNCTSDWKYKLDDDKSICEYEPKTISVNGSVEIIPSSSSGYLVTTWQITYPNDGSVDNSVKKDTTQISSNKNFTINFKWPGVRSKDTYVEVQYTVQVLDCNKNPLGEKVVRKIYWNPTVCPPPQNNEADLKIEKSSNITNPKCGDNFSYTIKVTNLGPSEAKAVQVTDIIPNGISLLSNSASQGSYNSGNGIWTIGNIANGSSVTLTLNVKADCELANNSTIDLGLAKDFNLFVLEDATQPSSDTEGKVAVGRDASFANYSIGDKLPPNSGDVLIVGRNLTFTSGRVYNGDVAYGNSTNLPINQTSIDGYLRKDNPINFAAAKTYLENLSQALSSYSTNGISQLQFSTLFFEGTDPHLNVFKVNASQINSSTSLEITAPNGSAVLINIEGDNIILDGGLEVYGTAINNVIYNFYQATNIKITNIDVRGTILAPFAAVNFVSGVQNGQMICKSLTGTGQFNHAPFFGNIPPDKKITNIATITGTLTTDPNIVNNSSSITIDFNKSNINPNTNNSSQATGSVWKEVGSFAQGESVYSMTYDNNSTYAGTFGGKVYESKDNGLNWSTITKGLNVAWIWSLTTLDKTLFAATEKGVYQYDGSNWTITNLKETDVRAIASNGNKLYAGTWGKGVYVSEDKGKTWTELNENLSNKAVQTIAVNKNGDLFAGTAGGGVFKIFNGENRWYQYNVGNNQITSIAITNESIVASTYGGGVYTSNDNGSNWQRTALTQNYIYSSTVDKNGKLYLSSWTSGVFTSEDKGSNWQPLGMGGMGVSSLVAAFNSKDVIAGTKEGKIFKITFNATNVENDNSLPNEFELMQNYPNPFNPETNIRYKISYDTEVKLKVYDILGREVANLVNEFQKRGTYNYKLSIKNHNLSSGVYFYQLKAGDFVDTKKLMIIK
ncbi:MAG: choice-of-anchor A family protein [Melioribacteraceae bacterium]|nr:choice-of-anchor A family protein [Melioribacteraceae bacterium]